MGSRFSQYKVLDYCYHPRHLIKDGKDITVPCNMCNGCLLHKANMLSQQVSMEIQSNPWTIFFTLTYNNRYLPKLQRISITAKPFIYTSDNEYNIRFNGRTDVRRNDNILIRENYFHLPITNFPLSEYISYSSKTDIQLWLKLLRKDLQENLDPNDKSKFFRYFIISEYGPTHYRAHVHGLLFPRTPEIANYLLSVSMYKNWKMCDEVLFKEYCSYCDQGTSTYVTNYVTGFASLPQLLKDPSIKPFRLQSVSPSIGFNAFDKKKVLEEISCGIVEYTRTIPDANMSSVLRYPTSYISRFFPKCYQFAELPESRLLFVYGYIYRQVRGYMRPYLLLSSQLRKTMPHPADFEAAKACFDVCELMDWTPFHYLYVLDLYYYKVQMMNLKVWYSWQEANASSPVSLLSSYNNLIDYVKQRPFLSAYQITALRTWCIGFGVCFDDLTPTDCLALTEPDSLKKQYVDDVDTIASNLIKMPKFNELSGKFHIY